MCLLLYASLMYFVVIFSVFTLSFLKHIDEIHGTEVAKTEGVAVARIQVNKRAMLGFLYALMP